MNEYLTSKQVAPLLQRSVAWVERARKTPGKGPPYYQIGKSFRYREEEVMAWLRSKRRD